MRLLDFGLMVRIIVHGARSYDQAYVIERNKMTRQSHPNPQSLSEKRSEQQYTDTHTAEYSESLSGLRRDRWPSLWLGVCPAPWDRY